MDPKSGGIRATGQRLVEIIEHCAFSHDVWTITRDGEPVAVIIGYDELMSLRERVEQLGEAGGS